MPTQDIRWKDPAIETTDKGRSKIRIVSAVLVVLFTSALAGAWTHIWELRYITQLSLWFMLSLSLFHCYFSAHDQLTGIHLRLIDYVYLGAAALGVILLAAGQEDRRVELITRSDIFFSTIDNTPSNRLRNTIFEYRSRACVSRPQVDHCNFAARLMNVFDKEPTAAELGKLASDFDELLKRVPGSERHYSTRMVQAVLNQYLASSRALEEKTKALTRPKAEPDILEIIWGLGQTWLWPFILVIALALRITRVSIEMLGWAEN